MNNIPKIAHFYWGGKILPYVRYMTLFSFRKYNHDWKIILYIPAKLSSNYNWPGTENKWELNTTNYFDKLSSIGIEVKTIDMSIFGLSNDLPEVTKSDYLRLHLLSTIGGLWSDTDIIYFKKVSNAFKQDSIHNTYICYNSMPWGGVKFHSIGFIFASGNNQIFGKLCSEAKSNINSYDYQAIGSPFYEKFINISDPTVYNIPFHIVYPIHPFKDIWELEAGVTLLRIRPDTVGVHWYAGHKISGQYQNIITDQTYKNYNNIVTYYIAKANE